MNERIIAVTGKGVLNVTPDIIRLTVTLSGLFNNYNEAYERISCNTKTMSGIAHNIGLDPKLSKTVRMDIEKKYEPQYDNQHNYVGEKFLGYELAQVLKIEIPVGSSFLGQLIRDIGRNLKDAEIELGYAVKDPHPSQLKMLEMAVLDAKEKASIMAEAAGCVLGEVKSIDASEEEVHFYTKSNNILAKEAVCLGDGGLDVEPNDFNASESVTAKWTLKDRI